MFEKEKKSDTSSRDSKGSKDRVALMDELVDVRLKALIALIALAEKKGVFL
jgi:hypothetical protein